MKLNDEQEAEETQQKLAEIMLRIKTFFESLEKEYPGFDFQGSLALPTNDTMNAHALTSHMFMSNIAGSVICSSAMAMAAKLRAKNNDVEEALIESMIEMGSKMGASLAAGVDSMDNPEAPPEYIEGEGG